jgi:signal transduction histidine kinase
MTAPSDIVVNGHPPAGIAHDFNNLLTVILVGLGTTRVRLNRSLDPDDPVFQELQKVVTAARAAVELIASVSVLGGERIQPVALSPNDLLHEMEPLLCRSVSRGVELRLELEPGLPDIYIDRIHFRRILLNLVVNANAAMPHGGELTVRTWLDDDLPDIVHLTVGDTGNGMCPETAARIFEPFYTTRPSRGGTGLGLSIVHAIISQCGGRVSVESELGFGTTFTLELPVAFAESRMHMH